jgi:hypothetical protein
LKDKLQADLEQTEKFLMGSSEKINEEMEEILKEIVGKRKDIKNTIKHFQNQSKSKLGRHSQMYQALQALFKSFEK